MIKSLKPSVWLAAFLLFNNSCSTRDAQSQSQSGNTSIESSSIPESDSFYMETSESELDHFVAGVDRNMLLNKIQHRGAHQITCFIDGKKVEIISYKIAGSIPFMGIFENDRFSHFTNWVYPVPLPQQKPPPAPTEYKKYATDDFELVRLALKQKSLSKEDVIENHKATITFLKKQSPDYGLTAAFGILSLGGIIHHTSSDDMQNSRRRNFELIDKFNGMKINLGDSREEIEKIFGAPIRSKDHTSLYESREKIECIKPGYAHSYVLIVYDSKNQAQAIFSRHFLMSLDKSQIP